MNKGFLHARKFILHSQAENMEESVLSVLDREVSVGSRAGERGDVCVFGQLKEFNARGISTEEFDLRFWDGKSFSEELDDGGIGFTFLGWRRNADL